jgi:type II secretory pathway pseudopilin PulG
MVVTSVGFTRAKEKGGRTMNDGQLPAPPNKRHRGRNILAVVAAVVVIGGLASITTITLLRNATLSSQAAAADTRAANAVSAAQAAAQKDYAARNATLNQKAATLNQKSQTIAAETGELKANTIRTNGMYVVGHDIKSGTWHTVGDGHLSGNLCRYVVLASANSPGPGIYFDGPETLNLSGDYALVISGPCTWIREP